MNYNKWIDPKVPMVKLAAKLAEECGETVAEILNNDEEGYTSVKQLRDLEMEAAHAEFLASVIKSRAQGMRFRLTHRKDENPKKEKS